MAENIISQSTIRDQFATGGDRLNAALQGLTEADLDCREAPGEWTIRQIVHHLADDGDAWSECIKKAIATPGGFVRFEGFPGNEPWANALAYHLRPIETSLGLIQAHRRYLAALIDYFPNAWEQGIDLLDDQGNVAGHFTVGQMAKMLSDHFDDHIATIERIKAAR